MKKRLIPMLLAALLLLTALICGAQAEQAAAPPARTIDLTEVCEALLTLLAAAITCWLVPLIRAHTSAKTRLALDAAYRTAVYGAQQLYKAGVIKDRLACAERWLQEQGYTVDRTRLEAHVKTLNINTAFESMEVVTLEQTSEITLDGNEEVSDDG